MHIVKCFRGLMAHPVRRKLLLAATVATFGITTGSAHSAVVGTVSEAPQLSGSWAIGQASDIRLPAVTAGAVYSNKTTFSGFAANAGTDSSTDSFTALLADDITTTATAPFLLGQYTFSITNLLTSAQTISPHVRFYATDGTGGGPGTFLGGVNYSGISIPAGTVNGFNSNVSSLAITLPPTFWVGEYFSTTSTATNAAADIGEGIFGPPDVGSSADQNFGSSTVGSATANFTASNPAGTVNASPYGGAPPANYEFEFNAVAPVPEPTSVLAIAPIAIAMIRRRRRTA